MIPLVLLGLLATTSASSATTHKVDYTKVAGASCLRPVVRSSSAAIDDYKTAQRRWLEENYPGYHATNWSSVIEIPEDDDGTPSDDGTIKEETAFVQAADGSSFKVCFEVGAKQQHVDDGDDDADDPPAEVPIQSLRTSLDGGGTLPLPADPA